MAKKDMTPLEIKIEFMKHGVSQAGLGRQCGVTQGHVYRVISGQSISDRVQREIAKAINKKPEAVFPTRYPARGKVGRRLDLQMGQAAI